MNRLVKQIFLIPACLGLLAAAAAAQTASEDRQPLQGLKTVQVYFDVNLKDDNLLALRMELLDRTVKDLEDAGLDVVGVIGFRGHASRFITIDDHYVLAEEVANKRTIQLWVKRFSEKGLVIEQCAIAAEILDIPTKDFLPEATIVDNGYVSLVGYQAQGYSVVPMD